ncbi:MAG: polyketide synthase dehydratase domain-containing protein [Herpetosiphonaceae bacterium]|nr:polyketide synthase dehydratase domain-containing protein [Herpetosiphonaceae bacterium]
MTQAIAPVINHTFQIGLRTAPYLADHRVGHGAILPLATYLDLSFTLGTIVSKDQPCAVEQIRLHEMHILHETPRTLNIALVATEENAWQFEIGSQPSDGSNQALHATGMLRVDSTARPSARTHAGIRARCNELRPAAEHYAAMEALGIHYGPSFHVIESLWRTDGEALGQLRLPYALEGEARLYHVHPVLLDGAIQSIMATQPPETALKLPVAVQTLALYAKAKPGARLWAHSQVVSPPDVTGSFSADVTLLDDDGAVVGLLGGVLIQSVQAMPGAAVPRPAPRPAANGSRQDASTVHVEATLRAIWREFLEVRELDAHDPFFELGGDSITASQIADKSTRSGYQLSPLDILEHQTIAALVAMIAARKDLAS